MAKIPKHAKKVFQGDYFSIYQWQQKMFDGSYRRFEIAQRLYGASVIATVDNKIVMLYQKQPGKNWFYSLPGGIMDIPGESPRHTAKRELLEETGLKPQTLKLWKINHDHGRVEAKHYLFIAQNCTKVAEQRFDGGEKIKVMYLSFEEFINTVISTNFRNPSVLEICLRAKIDRRLKTELKQVIFGNKVAKTD